MAKFSSAVSVSRRKNRKAHFGASSVERRVRMSAPLSKDLFSKYHVRSLPVIKGDEVLVTRGQFKKVEGKILACYRKKYVIHVERCEQKKNNQQMVPVGIDASNVVITKLKLDKSRKAILDRKNPNKSKTAAVDNLAGVD